MKSSRSFVLCSTVRSVSLLHCKLWRAPLLATCFLVLLLRLAGAQSTIQSIEQPLVPTSAAPGSENLLLTINGANFAPTPSNLAFKLGTTTTLLPVTPTTFPTQLTATVPASLLTTPGTASVSLISSVGIPSNIQFFQIAAPASPQFATPADYTPAGALTLVSALTADFNGDGVLDLALGLFNGDLYTVCILLGNAGGTFPAACSSTYFLSFASNSTYLAAGRFTNDGGNLDLVAGYDLLVGNGDGTFTDTTLPVANFHPFAVGDFMQNGDLDIAGLVGANVQILNNDGTGTFTAGQTFTVGTEPAAIALADFNGDGILDLAVLDIYPGSPSVNVFLGKGANLFNTTAISTGVPVGVTTFTAGDFNKDGKQDLAVVIDPAAGGGQVLFLKGNGDGTFTSGATADLANPVTGQAVTADFNEDRNLDIATGTYVLLGNGDGTFQSPAVDYSASSTAQVFATGDFNDDGRPDLAALSGSTLTILLQAVNNLPVASLSPTSLSFGSQVVGTTSSPKVVTLTNTGSANLIITGIADAAGFFQTNNCPISPQALAPAKSCAINVTFTPAAAGDAGSTLIITDNADGSPQGVTLSGVGVNAPVVVLSPPTLDLGSEPLGTSSASQVVTLKNTGSANLIITSIAGGEGFSQTNNCPISPKFLAPAQSCTINVTITPTASGNVNSTLTITDNAAGSPQVIPLSAVGVTPFSLTSTCNSLTVVPGQTAIYHVSLAPAKGFAQSVSLSCSGEPALAGCTVSPAMVALDGATTVQATVTATTTPATSGALKWPSGPDRGNRLAGLLGLAGIAGLAGIVFLPRNRRLKRPTRLWGLIFCLCMLSAMATVSSCGGGAGADPPGTAAGTYPLTVTATFQPATGTAITQKVSFDLVVQ